VGKFDDDLHLVAPADFVPTTVHALFKQAGVADAGRAAQANAISAWLKAHKLTPMMEYSIRDSGFGELIDARATA
jgi:hypothetical protein